MTLLQQRVENVRTLLGDVRWFENKEPVQKDTEGVKDKDCTVALLAETRSLSFWILKQGFSNRNKCHYSFEKQVLVESRRIQINGNENVKQQITK